MKNRGCRTTRLLKVRAGLMYGIRRRKLARWQPEAIVGHCTFIDFLRRGSLTCFHPVCRFITSCYDTETETGHGRAPELRSGVIHMTVFISASSTDLHHTWSSTSGSVSFFFA